MATFYIFKEGSYIRKEGERLKITFEKSVIADIPLLKVNQVALFGPVQISTQALAELLKRDINVVFLTKSGKFRGRLQTGFSKNSILRINQFKNALNEKKRVEFAKSFVFGKLSNMKTLLLRHRREALCKPNKVINFAIQQLNKSIKSLKIFSNLDQVRGCEGAGSSVYFYAFKDLIKSADFDFNGRFKKPPKDPVNAMLSFLYTLLFKDIISICELVGFDPYVGFLHSEKYGKASLALDLMEEWRPVMVDALVLSLINKREVKPDSFQEDLSLGVRIKEDALQKIIESYERKKNSLIKHPLFKESTSYWKAMEAQARILEKAILGKIPNYKPFLIK